MKLNRRDFFRKSAQIASGLILAPSLALLPIPRGLSGLTKSFLQESVIDERGCTVFRFRLELQFSRTCSIAEIRDWMRGHPVYASLLVPDPGFRRERIYMSTNWDGRVRCEIEDREAVRGAA